MSRTIQFRRRLKAHLIEDVRRVDDMKKKKDFVLILVNCVLVTGIVLFTQLNARDQEQIHGGERGHV